MTEATIAHIKLANGIDLMGEVYHEDDKFIELSHPMMVVIKSKGETGYYHMSPYSAFSERSCFSKRFVVERGYEIYPELLRVYEGLLHRHQESQIESEYTAHESQDIESQDEEDEPDIRETLEKLFGVKPKSTLH